MRHTFGTPDGVKKAFFENSHLIILQVYVILVSQFWREVCPEVTPVCVEWMAVACTFACGTVITILSAASGGI